MGDSVAPSLRPDTREPWRPRWALRKPRTALHGHARLTRPGKADRSPLSRQSCSERSRQKPWVSGHAGPARPSPRPRGHRLWPGQGGPRPLCAGPFRSRPMASGAYRTAGADARSNPLKTFFSLKLQNFISKLFRTSKNLIEMMETFPSARLQPPGHTSRHRCAGTRDRKGPHTAPLTSASLPHRPLPPTARALGELGCARHGVPDAAAGLLRPVRGLSPRRARPPRASSLQRGPAARVGLRPAGGSPRKHLPGGMTHHSCLCVRRCEALARGRGAFPGQAARRACARDGLGCWTVAGPAQWQRRLLSPEVLGPAWRRSPSR